MELQYLNHMRNLLVAPVQQNRTGISARSIFGFQMYHDFSDGFPLLTTKRVHLKSIIHELLWFLSGSTNIRYLTDHGVTIWDEWADEDGELGPIYGHQWRNFNGVDQIKWVEKELKTNPDSRRLVVSAWNPADLEDMALPPCHMFFQFNSRVMSVEERCLWAYKNMPEAADYLDKQKSWMLARNYLNNRGAPTRYLDLQMYQRSADWFLGVPFNIASYSLLLIMMAQTTGMVPGEFIHSFGDTHLYTNHEDQAHLQLSRPIYEFPDIKIANYGQSITNFRFEDFQLESYSPHPAIKAPVAV